jgi:hypothetical protein
MSLIFPIIIAKNTKTSSTWMTPPTIFLNEFGSFIALQELTNPTIEKIPIQVTKNPITIDAISEYRPLVRLVRNIRIPIQHMLSKA